MEGTIGYITPVAFNFAPKSWAFCNGQIINITSNTALFSILGTTYGGNGTTTFALPDLQGRVPVGAGNGPGLSPYTLGQKGGSNTATMTLNNMPAHVHSVLVQAHIPVNEDAAGLDTPTDAFPAIGPTLYASSPSAGATLAANAMTANFTLGTAGSGQPFNTTQPYLALNYCVCLYGVFPARN